MKPSTQKKSYSNLSLSTTYKPPVPSGNQIVSSRNGSYQVFSRMSDRRSTVRGSGIAPAPTPLNTPSLKSENSGKDVLVSLVPAGSSNPVWSQQAADGKIDGGSSDAARSAPPVAKPAPWSKPMVAPENPATGVSTVSSKPFMRNWADDDSEDEPEDLIRPPARTQQSGDVRSGHGPYSAAPSDNQWQQRGQFREEDDYRGGGFGRQQFQRDERGGYQSNYGGYQDARTGAGGDRGGFSRYGSGGPSSGGFRGEMRPRGNSYDAGPGEAYPKRQYNVPPSRGSSGLQVAATLFGGAPASSGDSNHEEMDGAQEEVRALELARMEREAILHKKKQLELQQQRLAEQEKEREAVREKHNAMIALPQPVDSQQEAVGGDYNRSARGIGGGYSGTRDDRGFAEERHRHISDGEDSWRRGPSWPSGTSNAHGDSRDDAFGRRAAAHRGPERLTSGPEAVSKMQQGTVHVMHRPPAAMTDTSNKGEVVSSSQHAHSGSQIHQNIAAAHHHGPTEARQLYDPKTGSFYASDRTGKPIRSNSHDEGNSNNKNAPREDKPIKIKSKEKRSGSEDKTHHEPEESVAARKAREEAAAKKEARDKEKASRPPHSKGLLFRYTDEAKTVGMIEQVLSAEEAAKKASDDAQKQKKMDDKVDGKRQKLKALEDRKIRDLLKRSGTESANKQDDSDMKTLNKNEPSPSAKPTSVENDSNFVDEDHEDDNSSVDAALMADYLLASGAKKNVEPIGVVGTIVFGVPTNSFILSEPEALADFTEVTRKRAAKPVVAPVPSSGKKRNRNERAENSLKKDFVPASKEPQANRELTIVAPTVPTAPVPQVSLELPAKPAWSAPKSTLKLVVGATAGDVNEAPSPHADLKKQRHDEKQVKKPKAEKKDELRKKSKEMKARMAHPETSLIGLKTENVAVVKDHRKTNDATSAFLEGKLAPSLKSPPLVFAQNESSYHQDGSEFNRSIESDRYAASAALLPSGSNPHTSTTLGRTESSSSVEDIHAVAEKLPSRNKDSYPVFIPGKGVVIVPVSPGAADVQWKAAPQQSQQINFSPGSSGHKAVGHGYNSSAGSSFPTSANQGVMGPALSGTNWGAELDQFSQFSGANGQNWQREPFIESVEAEAIHSRTGRNNPSSSRLQSWSNNAVNSSPEVGKSGGNFFPPEDKGHSQFSHQDGQHGFYIQQHGMSDRGNNPVDSYDYQFNNQRNDYKSNAFGKSVADTLSYDNGIHSADNKINVGADKSQEAFGKPAKIGSFEDLDDQVVIHPNGALEGGDGARQMLSTRGGKQYSRSRASPRDGTKPPIKVPAGRNGGFYQHPHAAVESESNAVAEDSRPFAAGVIATPKPAGKGRVEKKFASKKSERSEFSSKNLKKANTQKDSERSERPDKLAKPVGGRDEGRIEGPGTSQSGRVEIHGTRSAGRNGGRGRGRGRGTPAMPDPTSKITAAPKTAGPQVLVSKPDDTSAGRSGGLGRGGRGSSRGGRGGRGRGFDNRGPPAIPREVV